jgi:hypothetical protein
LIGIGFQASAMFFTYEFAKRMFSVFKRDPSELLPIQYVALAGACASLPTSLIAVLFRFTNRVQLNIPGLGFKSKGKERVPCTMDLLMRVRKS